MPGSYRIRTPVGSWKSKARSGLQNSPERAPSGVITTFWANTQLWASIRPEIKGIKRLVHTAVFLLVPPGTLSDSGKVHHRLRRRSFSHRRTRLHTDQTARLW